VLVEFIGAAGTGKTFLSDKLVDTLRDRKIAARHFNLIKIHKIAPRNLVLAIQAAYLAFLTRPKSIGHLVGAINVIARYSIRRVLCEHMTDICVTSEGLFHRIITLHRNSNARGIVEISDILFSKIRPPDVVIIIEADFEKVFARRKSRSRINDQFSIGSVKADIAAVREAEAAIVKIKDEKCLPARVLQLRTDEDGGEKIIEDIFDVLKEFAGDSWGSVVRN
jgi:hypothetical protein